MSLSEKIKSRREELGLSDVELAHACGLTTHSYCDIELYPDELCEVVSLRAAKRLSSELRWNLLDLLEIPCAFCAPAGKFEEEYSLPPSELIRHQREKHRWSVDDFGNRINYHGIEMSELEADPNRIEDWRINDLKRLSAVLEIPLQLLLGVRCASCGR